MNEDVANLVSLGKLTADAGEKVSALEPGTHCLHKSWGVGKIANWDLVGGEMSIDFEGKAGHAMKLEFAAKSLQPLSEVHVLARRFADPDGLQTEALDDPVTFAKSVLTSFGGSMMLDEWESVVKGPVVPEGKYRSWWDNAKKTLRKDHQFSVPSKRNVPFELRDEGISPGEAYVADFKNAKDPKASLDVINDSLKNIKVFEGEEERLQELVDEINTYAKQIQLLDPIKVIEMIQARDEVIRQVEGLEVGDGLTLAEFLQSGRAELSDVLKVLPAARQRDIYKLLPEILGEDWFQKTLDLLQVVGARGVGELSRYLNEIGKGENLHNYLKQGIQQRAHSSDLTAWICKERKKAAKDVFSDEVGPAIISAIERDHYDEALGRSARLREIISDDVELIADLLDGADRNQVRSFARRIKGSPVFDDLSRGSLLARIVKLYPDVQDLVSGEREAEVKDESLVVSWTSLAERKKALEHLRQKEIPENTKEIATAREHGDLRENFEYKAAKEMQAVLMRREAEMESELMRARGTDFSDADTSVVSVGTVVEIEDADSGEKETFSILGAWDTDTDKRIISYLSETGSALIGSPVGEEVEVPTEREGETRIVRVASISAAPVDKGSADKGEPAETVAAAETS
ncbi:MAG: GreA/GreB family elongation factor [Verrucomicrobiota bacterium]